MGGPEADWCLGAVRGLTREAGIALLDRAAEVGLLTTHGDGYYTIHPALPWFFKSLFDQFFADGRTGLQARHPSDGPGDPSYDQGATQATRASVEAMGGLGNYYFWQYEGGNRDVIAALSAEEANVLHARYLARTHGWWDPVTSTMQGLQVLYEHTGRRAEWRRVVDEIVPDFVDPATDGPLPGREEDGSPVTNYRVRLAQKSRDWDEAERLQRVCVDWDRKHADEALAAYGPDDVATFVERQCREAIRSDDRGRQRFAGRAT